MTDTPPTLASAYDVVIVGAGPAGAAAAAGFAGRGKRVLLLEANPKASTRLAGEWIHPTGARILAELGLTPHEATASHEPSHGFVVFPDAAAASGDREPIVLPYADGAVGFSCEHHDLVVSLRKQAAAREGVTYLERARVTGIAGNAVEFTYGGQTHSVLAQTIVGADGRSSIVRKSLGRTDEAQLISHMAGVELHGVEVPFEGHGHVFLGGPGPVLLYRIGPDRVRACLDVEAGAPGARRDASYLWEAFGPVLPESLRPALRHALRTQRLTWACNRFLPRTFYGRDTGMGAGTALVGDAVGFYHPLTASGISIGLKDAAALLRAESVADYQREREQGSYVPELLANALYQVFTREDAQAAQIRRAVYDVWRQSPAERERTMRILAGSELRTAQFGSAFVRVALRALRVHTSSRGVRGVSRFVEFAQWPGATLVPAAIRRRIRKDGTALQPLRGLGVAPTLPDLPEVPARAGTTVDVDGLLARVAENVSMLSPIARRADALSAACREQDLPEVVALATALLDDRATTGADQAARAAALRCVRRTLPGVLPGRIDAALRELAQQVRADEAALTTVRDQAHALEALHHAGVPIYDPLCRRLVRAIGAAQNDDGSFGGPTATAIVARALLVSGAPLMPAVEEALTSLGQTPALGPDAADALALYRDRRATRVEARKSRSAKASADDHRYCDDALLAVSRSFARPIQMLPGDLKSAVTCGYLLCRIADTVEDHHGFTMEERDARYAAFLAALEQPADGPDVLRFEQLFADVDGEPTEVDLCQNLSRVLRVFRGLPQGMQDKTARWAAEMTRGMQIYSHRAPGPDGFTALHTNEDLERYCYFVAGTVGHMLTDLFVEGIGEVGTDVEHALRTDAEAFGLGLQFVNILKDVTDDRERNVSFIPRTACFQAGLQVSQLTDPALRKEAHRAVAPLFDIAQSKLDRALEYVISIPAEHVAIRLFCLLPLWMAVRTLVHGRGNDAMFVAGAPVKIARSEVEQLITDCMQHAGDDAALRDRYDALWRAPLSTPSSPSPGHAVH